MGSPDRLAAIRAVAMAHTARAVTVPMPRKPRRPASPRGVAPEQSEIEDALRADPTASDRELAARLHTARRRVSLARAALGIEKVPNHRPAKVERNAGIVEAAKAGLSYAEIGKRFGLAPGRAYEIARRLGVPQRRRSPAPTGVEGAP